MTSPKRDRSFQLPALIVVSILAVVCIFIVSTVSAEAFIPYFGRVRPAIAASVICAAGIIALAVLRKHWCFSVYGPGAGKRRFLLAAVLAIPLMMSVTLADFLLRFPVDMNVPTPMALLFYPAVGYVAQIALHVVPLVLLLEISGLLFPTVSDDRRAWTSIALVAGLEAWFQVAKSMSDCELTALGIFVAAQLFVFGLLELYLFRRFDFVTMYVFRLSYYGYWHIAWGYLRLYYLF